MTKMTVVILMVLLIVSGTIVMTAYTHSKRAHTRGPETSQSVNRRTDECAHLFNVNRSEDWQTCMGVGPK